jgi:hypothetical protein
MLEALLAAALIVALALVSAATQLGLGTLFVAGTWLMVGGMAAGLPAGLFYHLALRRALGRRGVLPPRWWLNPTPLHAALLPGERFGVLAWFYLGAAGFLTTVGGCLLLGLASARS